jgi:hypothetical protein
MIDQIDSAFQLTEHLKALHNFLTHPIGSNGTIAVDKEMALKLAEPPDNVDRTLWLYELCRFLTQKVNSIIVALFSDSPPCSSTTCPEMRASEWQYLCAVHDPPKPCCAIDYCCHTLDWAANTLTSPKHFPSRLALGSDSSTQHSQARQLTNIFRRVYRIFAHAWFQHREMFWKVEARSGLYIFFKTVCDYYGLIPEDNYTIPSEAEGIEPPTESRSMPPLILKREPSGPGPEDDNTTIIEGLTDHNLSTAGTTKRHRHSPSVGATAVSTVVEEAEEEEERPQLHSRPVTQIFETPSEETEMETPEESSDEAEAESAEESVPVVPQADNEPEKQSTSEDAKADPAHHDEEKQSGSEAAVSNDADDAAAPNTKPSEKKPSDPVSLDGSSDAKDDPEVEEAATDAAEAETAEKISTSASAADDAEEENSGK